MLKERWKILGQTPKYNVDTQIDVMIAAFALHNYIRMNSHDDLLFTMVEHSENYRGDEELLDVYDPDTSNEIPEDRSTTMRETHNNIAKLIWKEMIDNRHVFNIIMSYVFKGTYFFPSYLTSLIYGVFSYNLSGYVEHDSWLQRKFGSNTSY